MNDVVIYVLLGSQKFPMREGFLNYNNGGVRLYYI